MKKLTKKQVEYYISLEKLSPQLISLAGTDSMAYNHNNLDCTETEFNKYREQAYRKLETFR